MNGLFGWLCMALMMLFGSHGTVCLSLPVTSLQLTALNEPVRPDALSQLAPRQRPAHAAIQPLYAELVSEWTFRWAPLRAQTRFPLWISDSDLPHKDSSAVPSRIGSDVRMARVAPTHRRATTFSAAG